MFHPQLLMGTPAGYHSIPLFLQSRQGRTVRTESLIEWFRIHVGFLQVTSIDVWHRSSS